MNQGSTGRKSGKKSSRREFIEKASKSTAAIIIAPNLISGCNKVRNSSAKAFENDLFDEALQKMSDIAPLGNHGPMAAEALVALGESKRLPTFVNNFLTEFSNTFPSKKQKIEENKWQDFIGKGEYITDWTVFFEQEVSKNDWKNLVSKWSNRLAPGLSASATHGLIRTGHAVRSLKTKVTDLRKRELAQAFGYWAAQYQEIPTSNDKRNLRLDLPDAIAKIPILPPRKFIQKGNIMLELRNLNDFKEFTEVTNFIELKGDPEILISNLTEAFSIAYLERITQRNLIRLIHIITSLASIRSLLSLVPDKTKEKMLFYGWQAGAGLISISGENKKNEFDLSQEVNQRELIQKAVESNEVHAIKFTEACLREYKLSPKSSYLLAAKDAVDRLT